MHDYTNQFKQKKNQSGGRKVVGQSTMLALNHITTTNQVKLGTTSLVRRKNMAEVHLK